MFKETVEISKQHFPKMEIKYKNESFFMKVLNIILFFHPKFMNFTTTVGNTIYFPSRKHVEDRDFSSSVVLMHELVHVYDTNSFGKLGYLFFGAAYLFPQILVLLFFPLLLVSWKIALIALVFLAPLPAYWRMKYERKAYFTSLYVMKSLEEKFRINYLLEENKKYFVRQFTGPNYYFMWVFPNIKKQFDQALVKINANQKPFEDPSLDIIDNILNKL